MPTTENWIFTKLQKLLNQSYSKYLILTLSMEGWCVHVILKISHRTRSVSDCFVLFFDREKEQLNALLQVAQVSLKVVLFTWFLVNICEESFIASALPGYWYCCGSISIMTMLFKNWALFTQNLQAKVHRVNKVGLFSRLLYEPALVLFENFHIEHAASYFYLYCLSLLDNLVMRYTVTQSVSLDCCL